METSKNTSGIGNEKEIDLSEIFSILWNGKILITGVTSLFSILAVTYSLSLPNIYQSKAMLSSVNDSNNGSLNQAMQGYSGLASLAGINLSNSSSSKSVIAIEKLKTLSFFEKNILPNIFLPDLMALESWDADTNNIIYNKEIFNNETQAWVRQAKYPLTQIPSAQESHKAFMGHLNTFKDVDTGFFTITIKHQSPHIAKAWTELIIEQLNHFFREKDKIESQAAMNYLNFQMLETSFSEIKLVIAQLLQQKMQQLTLIEASEFYVFDYIDPPVVMETKSEPNRSLLCILGAFMGAILGILIVLARSYTFHSNKHH